MITGLCLFHLMTRRSPADHANPREPLGGLYRSLGHACERTQIIRPGAVPDWRLGSRVAEHIGGYLRGHTKSQVTLRAE
jgi:hypothetical protein